MHSWHCALALLATACSAASTPAPGASTASTAARAPASKAPPPASTQGSKPAPDASDKPDTRYRKGDYVVYEYSGSALRAPVTLTEEIVEQRGLRLEIQVTMQRGDEQKTFIQVVTDTADNRASDKIDALYLLENGQRRRLENQDNQDIYQLYQWVIPPLKGPIQNKSKEQRDVQLGDRSYALTCTTGTSVVGEQAAQVEFCEGEAFLWTKGSSKMVAKDGGKVLFQMVVKDVGQR